MSDEKKNSFKQCALSIFVKAVVSFDLRNDDVLNLKRISLFFAYLANFHVFWAFLLLFQLLFDDFFAELFLLFLGWPRMKLISFHSIPFPFHNGMEWNFSYSLD